MKIIPLTRGAVALIDDEDYDLISKHRWHAYISGTKGIAACTTNGISKIYMHRMICCPPPGLVVDHINGLSLDNRRSNLRVCTVTENLLNRSKDGRCLSSPYKGVRRLTRGPKDQPKVVWKALIGFNKKKIHLGIFKTEEEAARAYDTAAKQYFGPFARLNFPNEHQLPPLTEIAKEPVRCLPDCGKNFP
jgi:hypothetical protein